MPYYCHQCNRMVTVSSTPDLHCSECDSDFVENIEPNDELLMGGGPAIFHSVARDSDSRGFADDGEPDDRNEEGEGVEIRIPRNSSGRIFVVHHGHDDNGGPDEVIVEGTHPFTNMLQPESPFSQIFGRMLNIRRRNAAAQPSDNTIGTQQQQTQNTESGGDNRPSGSGGGAAAGTPPSSGSRTRVNAVNHNIDFLNQLMSTLAESANAAGGGGNGRPGGGRPAPTRLAFRIETGANPFQNIIHGNINDYAFGEGGVDAIVTQLLNQFEGARTEHLSAEDLARLPMTEVNENHVENGAQCTTCMETFALNESVVRLDCQHIFHRACIDPWLKKRNTCPICRKVVDPKAWGPSATAAASSSQIMDVDELD